MRGGYRHYFLRVSDDNADEYDSANLHVLENRTIELQVEEVGDCGVFVPTRTHRLSSTDGQAVRSMVPLQNNHRLRFTETQHPTIHQQAIVLF